MSPLLITDLKTVKALRERSQWLKDIYDVDLSEAEILSRAVEFYIKSKLYNSLMKSGGQRYRTQLWKEQKHKCYYCPQLLSRSQTTIDHRIPIARGGSQTSKDNMVVACKPCNGAKGMLTEFEFAAVKKVFPNWQLAVSGMKSNNS